MKNKIMELLRQLKVKYPAEKEQPQITSVIAGEINNSKGFMSLHSNPNFFRVDIGDFTLCEYDTKSLWIEDQSGDGMQISSEEYMSVLFNILSGDNIEENLQKWFNATF